MTHRTKSLKAIVISTIVLSSLKSLASPVTLNMDDIPRGTYFNNISTQGFRISPHCHVDVESSYFTQGSKGLGFDGSGCGPYNSQFTGNDGASARFDFFGKKFDLYNIGYFRTEAVALRSSNGGFIALDEFPTDVTEKVQLAFATPEWRNIEWFELLWSEHGAPGFYLADLTYSVPTPSSGSLLFAAMCACIFSTQFRPRRNVTRRLGSGLDFRSLPLQQNDAARVASSG